MPKVRGRARIGQEFSVAPWQSANRDGKDAPPAAGALYTVQRTDLVPQLQSEAQDGAAAAGPASRPAGPAADPEPGSSTGWLTRPAKRQALEGAAPAGLLQHDAAGAADTGGGLAGAGAASVLSGDDTEPPGRSGGGDDTEPPSYSDGGDAVGSEADEYGHSGGSRPDDDSEAAAEGRALRGICQLAITPSGRGVGHLLVSTVPPILATGTAGCSGAAAAAPACYGIATRPVAPTVVPDPCVADDSIDLLHARLTNFATGATAECTLARSGGDMCRLAPPEAWLLRAWLGEEAEGEGAAAAEGEEARGGEAEVEDDEGWGDEPQGGGVAGWPCALGLEFEAETLLSGEAALPKLREFARPLLPRGCGTGGGGGAAAGDEAMVVVGPVTLRGLARGFIRGG